MKSIPSPDGFRKFPLMCFKSHLISASGFTLIELLIAAAMGVIIAGIAIGGLVTVQNSSQKTDQKLEQQAELQRALNYIATDIQEGQQIRIDQYRYIQDPPYKLLFYILRANQGKIAYYFNKPNARDPEAWKGPIILYRKRWPGNGEDFDTPGVDDNQHALIDAIANESPSNPDCQFDPSQFDVVRPVLGAQQVGISIAVPKAPILPTRAIVCLRGNLATPTNTTGLDVAIDATARIRP